MAYVWLNNRAQQESEKIETSQHISTCYLDALVRSMCFSTWYAFCCSTGTRYRILYLTKNLKIYLHINYGRSSYFSRFYCKYSEFFVRYFCFSLLKKTLLSFHVLQLIKACKWIVQNVTEIT